MIARIFIAALVAGISPAAAWEPVAVHDPIPPRWDNKPYVGSLVVTTATYGKVNAGCITVHYKVVHKLKDVLPPAFPPEVLGCALVADDYSWCEVVIHDKPVVVNDVLYTPESTLRHEVAHCNGWPRTHPQDDIARLPRPRPKTPAEALAASYITKCNYCITMPQRINHYTGKIETGPYIYNQETGIFYIKVQDEWLP